MDGLAEFPHQSFDIVYCRVDRVPGPVSTLVACLTWSSLHYVMITGEGLVVNSNNFQLLFGLEE